MLNNRIFNILFILLTGIWILADWQFNLGTSAYGWLLFIYIFILFCGSYFIQWGFFIKSINRSQCNEKWIALSFDDGPISENTALILEILKKTNTEAVFFCIGNKMKTNEILLKKIIQENHLIGNHSYSHHPFFDLFGSSKMQRDIIRMSTECMEITGKYPVFFRPPYGVTNPNLKKAILKSGFYSIGWSIRSFDTIIKDEKRLLQKILNALKPGAILLLHDTSPITVKMLPVLLQNIKDRGYQVVRLDKMLNLSPYA